MMCSCCSVCATVHWREAPNRDFLEHVMNTRSCKTAVCDQYHGNMVSMRSFTTRHHQNGSGLSPFGEIRSRCIDKMWEIWSLKHGSLERDLLYLGSMLCVVAHYTSNVPTHEAHLARAQVCIKCNAFLWIHIRIVLHTTVQGLPYTIHCTSPDLVRQRWQCTCACRVVFIVVQATAPDCDAWLYRS